MMPGGRTGAATEGDAPRVRRLGGNPIIVADMLPGEEGANINGPSLIRAPAWLPNRLGEFYLYFAHHSGTSIRLAVADRLEGPWRIHAPGSMQLADAIGCRDHIASPDAHVDDAQRRIVMYFHGVVPSGKRQASFRASSADGVSFVGEPDSIAEFYLRMVPWRDGWIGMSKGGVLYRQRAGSTRLRRLWRAAFPMSDRWANGPGDVRHVALQCEGDLLTVYFTRIGDAPERILKAKLDLSRSPWFWRAGPTVEVLAAVEDWEGAQLPISPSRSGAAKGPEHALRDPAIFVDAGRTYLLYSVAGESGIAIAELI